MTSVSGVQHVDGYPLDRATISAITEPTLYVAGKADPEGAPAFRHWVAWAHGPVVARLFNTSLHGTDMLVPIAPEDQGVPRLLENTVLSFLGRFG